MLTDWLFVEHLQYARHCAKSCRLWEGGVWEVVGAQRTCFCTVTPTVWFTVSPHWCVHSMRRTHFCTGDDVHGLAQELKFYLCVEAMQVKHLKVRNKILFFLKCSTHVGCLLFSKF